MTRNLVRVFYAADIHGSEVAFRKWVNSAAALDLDALILGGDITGKIIVPIVLAVPGEWYYDGFGERQWMRSTAELAEVQRRLRASGRYWVVVGPDEKARYDAHPELVADELFGPVIRSDVGRWLDLLAERVKGGKTAVYIMLGNDDDPALEPMLEGSVATLVDGRLAVLPGGFEMISLGFSNPTPWRTTRELEEADIAIRLAAMLGGVRQPERAILNIHCPPYGTHLDQAALLNPDLSPQRQGGQIVTGSVGSTAVRAVVDKYQPLLGLHGHIHESAAVQRLGRTVIANPGSEYTEAVLRGALITLDATKGNVRSWQLIHG